MGWLDGWGAWKTRGFDWQGFTSAWIEHVERVVDRVAAEHPAERFYALVIHSWYAEEEGVIRAPVIAMNSLEHWRGDDPPPRPEGWTFEDERWDPHQWGARVELLGADRGALDAWYERLTDFAVRGAPPHWRAVEARHEQLLVDVAAALVVSAKWRAGAFGRLTMADDFLVFVREHDTDAPERLARKTIPEATFARIFGGVVARERHRDRIDRLAGGAHVAYLIDRLDAPDGAFGWEAAIAGLRAIGAPAVPALVARLGRDPDPWMAASVLAKMGAPAAAGATDALFALASRPPERVSWSCAMWSARALGRLGRLDLLATLERDDILVERAIHGYVAARPRAYGRLAACLDRGEPRVTELVTNELRPGNASYDLAAPDIDAAAAFAASPHEVLRKDVACALGDVPWSSRRRAVAALIPMLDDPAPEVRRLAALSLGSCGGSARSAVPHLARLAENDDTPGVAMTARDALETIGRRGLFGFD